MFLLIYYKNQQSQSHPVETEVTNVSQQKNAVDLLHVNQYLGYAITPANS